MTQKLSDWASVAEIISAIAIVISLIFVGFEIRRNTGAEYLSSYDRLLAEVTDWRMTLATNPETHEAWLSYRAATDPSSIDPMVRRTGQAVGIALVQIYERAYYARVYGSIGDAEWSRFQTIMCNPDSDAFPKVLSGSRGPRFSQEFLDYLAECVQE